MKIAPLAELVSTNVPWKQFRKETFIKLTRKPAPIAALVQMFARSKQSTRHKAKQALYLIDKAAPRDGLFYFLFLGLGYLIAPVVANFSLFTFQFYLLLFHFSFASFRDTIFASGKCQ
jgi:hypothetical protein